MKEFYNWLLEYDAGFILVVTTVCLLALFIFGLLIFYLDLFAIPIFLGLVWVVPYLIYRKEKKGGRKI